MTHAWTLLPHFLLRSTGFPFAWLHATALDGAVDAVDAVLDSEQRRDRLRAVVQEELDADDDTATRRLRRRCWKRVGRGSATGMEPGDGDALSPRLRALLERWDRSVAHHAELEEAARRACDAEMLECRVALRKIVDDPLFQEAVWLSSPQMADHGLRHYRERDPHDHVNAETRRIERQISAYLQRFCAKNETTSFFGPLNHGDFFAPGGTHGQPGAGREQRREAFVAHWAITTLAEAIARDDAVRPHLRPWRTGLYRTDGDGRMATTPGRAAVPLDPTTAEVLAAIDGDRTVAQIARRLGRPPSDVLVAVDRLVAAHIVTTGPHVPIDAVHPLDSLREWVAQLPAQCGSRRHWSERLDAMHKVEQAFGGAPLYRKRTLLSELEETFRQLTGTVPRRRGGALYADRTLIYEECVGGVSPLHLGTRAHETLLARLATVLDVFAAHACVQQRALRADGARLLSALADAHGDGQADLHAGDVPLLHLLHEVNRRAPALPAAASAWLDALCVRVAADPDAGEVVIDPADLPPINRAALAEEVLVTSPDIMLLARDLDAVVAGDFDVVVGECHDTMMVWGWPLYFHPQAVEVERTVAAALARAVGERTVANVLPSRRAKIIPFEYPGPTIEMLARSGKPLDERIPVSQVHARVEDGRPLLGAPGWPRLTLHNGELQATAHRYFSQPRVVPPPVDLGAHTPRIRIGRTIVQRERWRVRADELFPRDYRGDGYALLRDHRAVAGRLGLPRHVFARMQGERKPVLIDGHNLFLLRMLRHLVSDDDDEVVLTEMLPGPEHLWLRGHEGAYCAELRLGAVHAPTGMVHQ